MQGFPFDSQVTFDSSDMPVYDRAISSEPLKNLIRELFSSGVMPNPSNNLQVEAGGDGMTLVVNPGFAVVNGGLCKEDQDRTLVVTAADPAYDRIDTVVLRWNNNVDVRTADLYILKGTASAAPVRPALTRTDSIYEIGLADVFITRGVATITDEKITDTRYDSSRCGVVSSISEFDTTSIYNQIQSDLASFKSNEETDFIEWVDTIKDILDSETAGHLQLEIDALEDDVEEINNNLTSLITGTLVAGQTTLTISNSKIKSDSIIDPYFEVGSGIATEPISYETMTVNNGSVVFTFEERETNLKVGIRVL